MTTAQSPRRRWAPYLWLVYLLFFLRPLFLEPTPAWLWAVSGIALGLFLWLYFTAYRVRGLALALCIGGIFGIGAALAPLNPGRDLLPGLRGRVPASGGTCPRWPVSGS